MPQKPSLCRRRRIDAAGGNALVKGSGRSPEDGGAGADATGRVRRLIDQGGPATNPLMVPRTTESGPSQVAIELDSIRRRHDLVARCANDISSGR